MAVSSRWWGSFEASVDTGLHWRLGPLALEAFRVDHSWQIASLVEQDPFHSALVIARPTKTLPEGDEFEVSACGVSASDATLHLSPALADRAVVVRPKSTFIVPPGTRVEFFVGMSLWLRLEVGKAHRLVRDAPISRPPDTWFGANTMEGEVCYASRSTLRTSLGTLPVLAHRCVTPIAVQNDTSRPMVLTRMRLPAPMLNLYSDPSGRLWTQRVEFVRETLQDQDLVAVRVDKKAPSHVQDPVLVAEARAVPTGQALMHMMSAILRAVE